MEYQKQVDEMYFLGYHCCMKKNDITHDTPSFPSNDEAEALNDFSSQDGVLFMADPPDEP